MPDSRVEDFSNLAPVEVTKQHHQGPLFSVVRIFPDVNLISHVLSPISLSAYEP